MSKKDEIRVNVSGEAGEMKFRTAFNYVQSKGEVNTEPSMTVPDQAMTIKEILQRFAQGLPLEGARVEIYDEDDEVEGLPDLSNMDLAEREEAILQMGLELEELKEKLSEDLPEDVPELEIVSKKRSKASAQQPPHTSGPMKAPDHLPAESAPKQAGATAKGKTGSVADGQSPEAEA